MGAIFKNKEWAIMAVVAYETADPFSGDLFRLHRKKTAALLYIQLLAPVERRAAMVEIEKQVNEFYENNGVVGQP